MSNEETLQKAKDLWLKSQLAEEFVRSPSINAGHPPGFSPDRLNKIMEQARIDRGKASELFGKWLEDANYEQ